MTTAQQVKEYISAQAEPKQSELRELHNVILQILPGMKLWFDNGRDENNKVVTNPRIGYGHQTMRYANGKTRDFFQVGISGNSTGISVYILGIKDKTYLAKTYGKKIGKATITGYCIKFRSVRDLNMEILREVISYGVKQSGDT